MRVCDTSSFMLRLWGGCACEKPHHQSTFIRTILLVAKEPSLWLLFFFGGGGCLAVVLSPVRKKCVYKS